jgi:hypothetical protein
LTEAGGVAIEPTGLASIPAAPMPSESAPTFEGSGLGLTRAGDSRSVFWVET